MTTVRELLINFGAKLDKKDVKKVESQTKGLAGVIKNVLSGIFILKTGQFLLSLNEMASDVAENMNVINESFGENAQSTLDWAETFGNAAGRNRYEMEQLVGTMGSLLNPMMKGNTEQAAEMSATFAELGVDLGSFFNVADGVAIQALRSGLSGEVESLKKFGIVMNQDALEAFRLSQGISKSVKSMDIAEKTALRYNFILENTKAAQGDAIRTADGWANAKKGLIGKIKELATEAGTGLLPIMAKMAVGARKIITFFATLMKNTKLVTSIFIVLGGVVTAVAAQMVISSWAMILPWLKIIAILALVVLLVDDFLVFLDGGDSVIGRFIDSIFGPGSATAALEGLKDIFQILKLVWIQDVLPALGQLKEAMGAFFAWIGPIAGAALGAVGDTVMWVIDAFKQMFAFFANPGPGLQMLMDSLEAALGAANKFLIAVGKATGASIMGSRSKGKGARLAKNSSNTSTSSQTSITNHNTAQVNMTGGGGTAAAASRIADKIGDRMQQMNKRTMAAVPRG